MARMPSARAAMARDVSWVAMTSFSPIHSFHSLAVARCMASRVPCEVGKGWAARSSKQNRNQRFHDQVAQKGLPDPFHAVLVKCWISCTPDLRVRRIGRRDTEPTRTERHRFNVGRRGKRGQKSCSHCTRHTENPMRSRPWQNNSYDKR
jgi:hypothetical protein